MWLQATLASLYYPLSFSRPPSLFTDLPVISSHIPSPPPLQYQSSLIPCCEVSLVGYILVFDPLVLHLMRPLGGHEQRWPFSGALLCHAHLKTPGERPRKIVTSPIFSQQLTSSCERCVCDCVCDRRGVILPLLSCTFVNACLCFHFPFALTFCVLLEAKPVQTWT